MSPPPSFAFEQEAPAPAMLTPGQRRGVVGVVASACMVASLAALKSFSMDAPDTDNALGVAGAWTSFAATQLLGVCAWVAPVEWGLLAIRMFRGRPSTMGESSFGNALVIVLPVLIACALMSLSCPDARAYGAPIGGLFGAAVARAMVGAVNALGAWLFGVAIIAACIAARTTWRPSWLSTRLTVGELTAQQAQSAASSLAAPLAAETPAPRPPITIVVPKPPRTGSARQRVATCDGQPFRLPATSLLERGASAPSVDHGQLRWQADAIADKLEALGIAGHVAEAHVGPVLTSFEFAPSSAAKLSRIAGMADDLALGLAAESVRILAPIPGKSRVGFEVPNGERATVGLRQLLESERWTSSSAALPLALGTDTAGQPLIADLAEMPHLLVAGATGAGKSVGLNAMLASLLYARSPDELRLILIDAKVVEFGAFADVPHMYFPVVTETRLAIMALAWAVQEMDRRYDQMAGHGARNIDSYNARAKEKLPRIVIVVDEVADLLAHKTERVKVELCIQRLAQKARAAGIHLILATQRPSVDIITGTIKANFPARIAYKVAQRQDSQTILGCSGAERLLGAGDMLFARPGSALQRLHGAFIGETEVSALCDYLRAQGQPRYDATLLAEENELEITVSTPALPTDTREHGRSVDDLYDAARVFVANQSACSISQLQRHFGIGYNKAAKLVERLEADGVLGDGGTPRREAGRPRVA